MNKKKVAIYILLSVGLTLAWLTICPKYMLQGEIKTVTTKRVTSTSNWSQTGNGPKVYGKKTIYVPYQHIDPSRFLIGCSVIYMGCLGVFLYTEKRTNPEMKEN
jgi:hypothetical protein